MGEASHYSAWILLAGLGSVLIGLCHVFVVVWQGAGGGVRTIRTAIADRSSAASIIVVIDFLAGLFLAFVVASAGVTQPASFVRYLDEHPSIGWFFVGLIGPLLSDRALSGSAVRNRFSGWLNRDQAEDEPEGSSQVQSDQQSQLAQQLWRLRREAVHKVERRCWTLVQRNLQREAQRLYSAANRQLREDPQAMWDLVRLCHQFNSSDGRSVLPDPVRQALQRCSTALTQEHRILLLEALVEELINSQTWEPLEVFFGDAPAG